MTPPDDSATPPENDAHARRAASARAPLRFGLPSKGRLQSQTGEFLAKRGITLKRSAVDREYAGALTGVSGVELVFLQAGEMPAKLMQGDIHLGVTGEDLIRERALGWEQRIMLLRALGFGYADLIVAAPKCWIDVATMDDLDDLAADFHDRHGHPLRVATKYRRLARAYFREKGVAGFRVVDSQGATEGLVAAGAAEVVVDITSSGETLRANHLKILDDGLILKSQAHLCASLTAPWTPAAREALKGLLARVGGPEAAERRVAVEAEIDAEALARAEPALTRLGGSIRQLGAEAGGRGAVTAPAEKLGMVVDVLGAAGARAIESEPISGAVAAPTDSLYDRFVNRLARLDL